MQQLLTTKLFIPPVRPELVLRPRLIDRLTAELRQSGGFGSKLTLISAPAGFGKITLASEWVRTIETSTEAVSIAWLLLDQNDSNLPRFLFYLHAALGQSAATGDPFEEDAVAMLLPPPDVILTALINALPVLPDPMILVLDDYRLIDFARVHAPSAEGPFFQRDRTKLRRCHRRSGTRLYRDAERT